MWTTGLGWQEVVIGVGDLDRWIDAFGHLGDWTVRHRGMTDAGLAAAWSLPKDTQPEEAVIGHPAEPDRWIRLIRFHGIEAPPARATAQAWDTGGLFSVLLHSNDIADVLRRAQNLGWGSFNDIGLMEFENMTMRNVVLRAPDGCNFGIYEPQPRGTATITRPKHRLCPPVTVQQVLRDLGRTRDFFRDTLGWTPWFDGETRLAINQFGMPDNYAGKVPKKVAIVQAAPGAPGQLELIQWTMFEGRDLSGRAALPHRGNIALRWMVPDLARWSSHGTPARITLAPFGEVIMLPIMLPEGGRIELVARP
jgi:hypothetical protein